MQTIFPILYAVYVSTLFHFVDGFFLLVDFSLAVVIVGCDEMQESQHTWQTR